MRITTDFGITAYFLDPEQSKLKFKDTIRLLENSKLPKKSQMLLQLRLSIAEWSETCEKMIKMVDSAINSGPTLSQEPLDPVLAARFGLEDFTDEISEVGSIEEEIKTYKNFNLATYCKCN